MTGAGLVQRVVEPRDCVLALAIPTTKIAFHAARDRAEPGGLISADLPWLKYRREVVRPIDRLLPQIRHLGVRMVENITLGELHRLFDHEPTVVMLMAHGVERRRGAAVELADGLAEVPSVVTQIPPTPRIFDLAICCSKQLMVALKRDRPDCIVRASPLRHVTPASWLYIYLLIVHQLRQRPQNYLEAVTAVTLELRRQSQGSTADDEE